MEKKIAIEQTKLAFSLIQKLYLETSYLVREIEGMLAEEPENFLIGKVGGYAISTKRSTGLETNNVQFWMVKKLSVFFYPNKNEKITGGITNTIITPDLRVIYFRIILDEKNLVEPKVFLGVLKNFKTKAGEGKSAKNFENVMTALEYHDSYLKEGEVVYEDSYVRFEGDFLTAHLFDIENSEQIVTKIIKPVLKKYRA